MHCFNFGYNRRDMKEIGAPLIFTVTFVKLEAAFAAVWLLCRFLVFRKKKKIDWKREAILLLMFVNLAVIFRFVYFPRGLINGHVAPLIFDSSRMFPLRVNLVPYRNLFVYINLRDTLFNVAGNVLLFVPTGIILPIVYPKLRKWYKTVFVGSLISLLIELSQLPFYDRATDIDDWILNTAGVILGYLLYALIKRVKKKRNKREVMKKAVNCILILLILPLTLCGCAPKKEDKEPVVYDDMEKAFETSGLISANIGIFTKTVSADSVSYGECGSGTIIKKEGNTCYALTAKHVVSHPDSEIIIFTVNTELTMETIPGVDYSVLTEDAYNAMLPAEVVLTSDTNDLAVISFTSEEDLMVAELAETEPKVGDRILCVGHPEMNWYARSYGEVTSGISRFGESTGYPSNAMQHSAYIQVGSSGGGVFNEDMKLTGTITGAMISPDGSKFISGYMIPTSEINVFLKDWK